MKTTNLSFSEFIECLINIYESKKYNDYKGLTICIKIFSILQSKNNKEKLNYKLYINNSKTHLFQITPLLKDIQLIDKYDIYNIEYKSDKFSIRKQK